MVYVKVNNLDGKDLRTVRNSDFEEIVKTLLYDLPSYDDVDDDGNCYAIVKIYVKGKRIVPLKKSMTTLNISVSYNMFTDEKKVIEQIISAIEKWCKLQEGINHISIECGGRFLQYGYESGEEYLIHVLDGFLHSAKEINEVLDDFEYVTKWVDEYIDPANITKKYDTIVKYMNDSINDIIPTPFKIGCETDLRNGVARVFTTLAVKDPSRCEVALNYFTTGEINEVALALAKVVKKKCDSTDENSTESKYPGAISGKLFYEFMKDMLEDNDIHCFITYLSRFIMEVRSKYELPDVIKNEITLLYR